MKRSFLSLLAVILAVISFSSCKKDTNPVNTGTGNNNGGRDTSYGDAAMSMNGLGAFTCQTVFYEYDSSTHRLHLDMLRDSAFRLVLSLNMPNIAAGVYDLPPDSGAYYITFPSGGAEALIPFRDTMHFVLTKYDPITQKFSATFWLHFGVPLPGGITSIDNGSISDGKLVILPFGDKPLFGATVSGLSFPDTPSYKFTNQYFIDENMTAEAGDPNKYFYERLIVKFTPTPDVIGIYNCDGVHARIEFFTRRVKNFQQIDTDYNTETLTGTLTITDYNKGRRVFSGSFRDTVAYYYDPTRKVEILGAFKNMPLETY
jgi:hypothetical protein